VPGAVHFRTSRGCRRRACHLQPTPREVGSAARTSRGCRCRACHLHPTPREVGSAARTSRGCRRRSCHLQPTPREVGSAARTSRGCRRRACHLQPTPREVGSAIWGAGFRNAGLRFARNPVRWPDGPVAQPAAKTSRGSRHGTQPRPTAGHRRQRPLNRPARPHTPAAPCPAPRRLPHRRGPRPAHRPRHPGHPRHRPLRPRPALYCPGPDTTGPSSHSPKGALPVLARGFPRIASGGPRHTHPANRQLPLDTPLHTVYNLCNVRRAGFHNPAPRNDGGEDVSGCEILPTRRT